MQRQFWRRFPGKVVLLLTLILSTRCASTSESRLPDISILTPSRLQALIFDNYHKLKTFEGKARIVIELPGDGYNGYSSVYLKMPDSIYVKTEAILGIDIGALFLDAHYFAAYAPRENTLYYGETATLDLRDFLQVEIETTELQEIFTGLVQPEVRPASVIAQDGHDIVVSTDTGHGSLKYWVDADKPVVTKAELRDRDGKVVLKKEFQRIRKRKGIYLPQTIKVTRPQARERITVYYTSQKINKKIADKKFRIKTSKTARKVYWGDLEHPRIERKSTND